MLPKCAAVIRPQAVPPARVANQPGVKSKDLGLRDDLPPSAGGEWPHDVNHVGYLIDFQPVRDRGPADAALRSQPGNVEQAAAKRRFQMGRSIMQVHFTFRRLNVKPGFTSGNRGQMAHSALRNGPRPGKGEAAPGGAGRRPRGQGRRPPHSLQNHDTCCACGWVGWVQN
jgi:hypothetical protein